MSKKIMIADSEQWSVQLITGLARKKGYEAVVATNGLEAIERFMNHAPEMVFIDNMLEKLDGCQATRKIKNTELGKVIPVILMSAMFREGDEVRSVIERYGFNAFMGKPFSEAKVQELLDGFLDRRSDTRIAEPLPRESRSPLTAYDIEGELNAKPASDVLFDLYRNQRTGMLEVVSGEITKVLYLDGGNITFARSNSSRHKLGQMLLEARRITPEQYTRAIQIQGLDRGRTRLGMILVSMGALSEESLKAAVHAQVLGTIFSLLETLSGRYAFMDAARSPEESLPLDMNTLDVLMWGVRKLDGVMDFKAYLPSPELQLTRASAFETREKQVSLTYFERQILGLVQGEKTVGEVVSIGLLAQIPVFRILYSLLKIGLIETVDDRERRKADQARLTVPLVRDLSVPSRGRLISIGTARLLSRLCHAGKTGVLQVQKDGQIGSVFVREGRILFARSNLKQDRIGYLLLTSGKVTRQEYNRAIEIRNYSPTSRIGTIFVEMGAITLDDLHWIVKFQILRILKSIFELDDAEYAFSEGNLPTEEMITLDHSTPDLIMDCVRNMPVNAQVRVHQPLTSAVVVKAMDDNQIRRLISVTPAEDKLLASIGPGATLADLKRIDLLKPDEFDRVIYGFLGLGIVRAVSAAEKPMNIDELFNDETDGASPARSEARSSASTDKAVMQGKIAMMEREIEELRRIREDLSRKIAETPVTDPDGLSRMAGPSTT